ncbi:MerR family DNA-binding protein [Massilia sp. Dwa41.01b]|nr:MerR family DNA-binding protein [Massilia sp. Dwa41.01b]QNB01495.1 MerR family DNA-binding protein [Massilia sp. Se16.2.3]
MAASTACSVPTIRYFEQIGLLPRPQRGANGHRYYRPADLRRLGFIKRCRDFGFPIEQVRAMAALFEDGGRPCAEVRSLAQSQLDEVRHKIGEMRRLESSLAAFVNRCDASCSGAPASDCFTVEDMALAGTCRADCASALAAAAASLPPADGAAGVDGAGATGHA